MFIGEVFDAPVSSGGNSRLAFTAGYDFDTAMVNRHASRSYLRAYPSFSSVPRGTKRCPQVYKCVLAKSKGMGSARYPCAVLVICSYVVWLFMVALKMDLFMS